MADMGMAGMDHGESGGAPASGMDHSQMDHSKLSADEMAKMDKTSLMMIHLQLQDQQNYNLLDHLDID